MVRTCARTPGLGQEWALVQALKDARGKPPEAVPYWILFSPFQLTWSRVSEPGAWSAKGNQLDDVNAFMDWARKKRGLQYQAFAAQQGSALHVSTLVTPWHEAYAIADRYEAQVRTYEARLKDQERLWKRYMLAMLNGLRNSEKQSRVAGHRPGAAVEQHLNLTRVWEVEQDIKDDTHFWARCESEAQNLVQALESAPFSPIVDDLRASDAIKDVRANHAMMLILGRLHEWLSKTKAGNTYLARFARQNERLIVWQEPRYFRFEEEEHAPDVAEMVSFKHARKSLKSYWYFVKAYVEHIDKGKPGRMLAAVKWWSEHLYKVHLDVTEDVVDGVRQLSFSRYSLRQLHVASTKARSKVAFFAVLDTLYLVYTMASIVTTWRKDGPYEACKKVLTALGALTSAVSSRYSVVELVTMSRNRFEQLQGYLKEVPAPGSLMTPSQAAGKVLDIDILRHEALSALPATERNAILKMGTRAERLWVKRGLGAAGGVFDFVTGGWNALEEMGTGDIDAALAHGATAVGGLMVVVGFAMMVSPVAPVGAVLILVGNVAGLVGSVLAVYFDDTEVEEWVKFSYFGKQNADHGFFADLKKPRFAEGQSLVAFSKNLELQKNALENILFRLDATCSIFDDRFIIDIICRLVVKESRLWLGFEVTDRDGTTTTRQAFSPYHDFKYDPSNPRVRRAFMEPGVRAVKLVVQLDIYGDGALMHPRTPERFDGKYDYPVGPG